MDPTWKSSLWSQFGAAIDTLDDALRLCPDELWRDPSQPDGFSQFWYISYHTLFWLDLYLSGPVEGFAPPAPFGLEELEAGLLPERPYSKDELRGYLAYCREKCLATIEALTEAKAGQKLTFPWGEISFLALLLYNMRHVQEHAAQLSWVLGQRTGSAPGWVTKARG